MCSASLLSSLSDAHWRATERFQRGPGVDHRQVQTPAEYSQEERRDRHAPDPVYAPKHRPRSCSASKVQQSYVTCAPSQSAVPRFCGKRGLHIHLAGNAPGRLQSLRSSATELVSKERIWMLSTWKNDGFLKNFEKNQITDCNPKES